MLYIIVNPASKSGKGKKKWESLKQELDQRSMVYQALFTQKDKGAGECVKQIIEGILSAGRPDEDKIKAPSLQNTICVLGGDGTMNEVVNALEDHHNIALAYLPAGSSNDFARALGLSHLPKDYLARLKKPSAKYADSGLVTLSRGRLRRFCVSCGFGLDAAVCEEALDSKWKSFLNKIGLGKLIYAGIALKKLIFAPVCDCDIILEDGTLRHFEKFLFGAVMIQPYEGGGIKFAPMADCHDGKFDICIVAGLKKWRALYLLPLAFFGLHVGAKNVYFFKTGSITFKAGKPLDVHTDGEPCGKQQEIQLICRKNRLKFL